MLGRMAPHARLINVARGDVVDESALIAALQAGRSAARVWMFMSMSPRCRSAELTALENVVLLPHLGTAALEVREAMGLMAVENLRAFLDGEYTSESGELIGMSEAAPGRATHPPTRRPAKGPCRAKFRPVTLDLGAPMG